MRLQGLKKEKNIYFIGIGGISMSALAKFLSVCGYEVSGSDGVRGEETDALAFYGVKVYIGVDAARRELTESDCVVYTDAIPAEHTELKAARSLGKRLFSRAELLELICMEFPNVISVAGSHGKTLSENQYQHQPQPIEWK